MAAVSGRSFRVVVTREDGQWLADVPGLTATLMSDGWTDSISLPVGPLGGDAAGAGDAAWTNPPVPRLRTAAMARPPSMRRVVLFIAPCPDSWVWGGWGRPVAAPDCGRLPRTSSRR